MSRAGQGVYRYAHYFIAAEFLLSLYAFWPRYFSNLYHAPLAFHVHGLFSSLWMLLLAGQSLSANNGRFALHRKLGSASIYVFPFFLAGLASVAVSMSKTISSGSLFYAIYGAQFTVIDTLSAICVAWLFYEGVRNRKTPALHSRYFLATLLLLLGPIVGRAVEHLFLHIDGPQDFWLDSWCVRIANLVALASAAWLYAGDRRFGRPFAGVVLTLVVQMGLWEVVGRASDAAPLFKAVGDLPLGVAIVAAVACGAVLVRLAHRSPLPPGGPLRPA